MYVTEYRKALRDAGFDGFRVVLFSQTGDMKQATGEETRVEAFAVTPVDTAGAGDCFIGYVVAGLDQGLSRAEALRLGAAAAALKVTRPGTADAIPSRAEVDAFLAGTETK